MSEVPDITLLLEKIRNGSAESKDGLIRLLYADLLGRARARLYGERPGHTLAASDLTNLTLLKLLKSDELSKANNRHELYRAFARGLRQVLIDHARKRVRRPGRENGLPADSDLDDLAAQVGTLSRIEVISLDEAISALSKHYPRAAEVLELKFFAGRNMQEIADVLNFSLATVERESRFGLAWLRAFLTTDE